MDPIIRTIILIATTCLLLVAMVPFVQARSVVGEAVGDITTDQLQLRIKLKVDKFNSLVGEKDKLNKAEEEILYSEDQIDFLLASVGEGGRLKRDIRDRPSTQWVHMPINWKFQGSHSLGQQRQVERAFDHWEQNTCLSFQRLDTSEIYEEHHLYITNNFDKCSTYIGRQSLKEQPLNLGNKCFKEFGTILHEIGHALGFWHDQQRLDRDSYIRINRNSLKFNKGQFIRRKTLMNLAYDYNSVMHYNSQAGGFGDLVTETRDPMYQKNIGQRVTLSYLNIKAINLRYCGDTCGEELNCTNGGYTDPKNCSKCICPDLFSGQLCQDISPGNGICGGHFKVTDQVQELTSPGYEVDGFYANQAECAWMLETETPDDRIVVEFTDEFGIYDHDAKQCYHWVELFTEDKYDIPGYRMCGYERPTIKFKSKANRFGIVFKSLYETIWNSSRRGFKIRYYIEKSQKTNKEESNEVTIPYDNSVTVDRDNKEIGSICDNVDLTFLLDSSGSVGESNWETGLQFVNEFFKKETTMRSSVISFGNVADVVFELSDMSKRNQLANKLALAKWKDQFTNTKDALVVARKNVFKKTISNHVKRVILLTNGEANVEENSIFLPALLLRISGVRIHVLAVGRHANYGEAVALAGSKSRVMTFWSYSQLLPSIQLIKNMVCM